MRVGGNLVAYDRDGRVESAPEKSKEPSRKRKRRQKKAARAVQRLFETCKQVFAEGGPGVIPSPENVDRLRSFLDTLKPDDVDLSPNSPYFQNFGIDGPPPVTYLHLYDCPNFSIVLDVLGPPYSDDEGRTCTYYKEYAFSSFPGDATLALGENEEHAWLEERGSKPHDLVVRGAEYRGPRILER